MNPRLSAMSRRNFIGVAGVASVVPILAACSPNATSSTGAQGSGKGGVLKFWDMPWGTPAYNTAAQALVEGYTPKSGASKTSYQVVPWTNYNQTFASAIASKTGPAVSSGGGFQAFQYADQGAIAYADNLVTTLQKSGFYDDFLPGLFDPMKTSKGYVGIPWNVDARPIWYRKSLLEKAGVGVPTDWSSWLTAAKELKKIGVFGFGTGAGPSNDLGCDALVSLMINNEGGLFDTSAKPNCVTDQNIEAMTFVNELVAAGAVDPGTLGYTSDNLQTQWKNKTFGIGYYTPGLDLLLGDSTGDLLVCPPPAGPRGTKGGIAFVNNLMMYNNTPSQEASEAFLESYLKSMSVYWTSGLISSLPVLNSIVKTKEFQANTQNVKVIEEWVPICKSYGARSSAEFSALSAIENGQSLRTFTQTMLSGKADPKAVLQTLQTGLESEMK